MDRRGTGAGPADPADRVTLDESVNMAFLVVLESMTPAERVAFVLHDVFRYSFAEVAEIVGRTPVACRQLASSARRAEVVRDFKEAWEAKDLEALVRVLDPDAAAVGDGGGLVSAVLHPVEGGERIARHFVGLAGRAPSVEILERTVNAQPGLVVRQDGVTVTVLASTSSATGSSTSGWSGTREAPALDDGLTHRRPRRPRRTRRPRRKQRLRRGLRSVISYFA